MKTKSIIQGLLILVMGGALTVFTSCNKQASLSVEEIDDLKYLREEEKLARDVYLHSFELYGEAVFNNIASSEQKHMDKMLELLNSYDIQDPASVERGVFNNTELQHLYNTLITKSDSSLLDAFIVGAIIEDVDIFDIEENISRTNQQDILNVYDKLECGSRNHMRAFTNELEALGYSYTPQYISLEEYNAILAETSGGCGN
jgi:hypothetical protein